MKFAIRDDDLNYFFDPAKIRNDYKDIWNICPISMSAVPFIKGNWPYWVDKFEKLGPGIIADDLIKKIYEDNKVYKLGQNKDLVDFIKDELKKNHIYITLHAIHHRNEDEIIPQFKNNFGVGAEFFTTRDLTQEVSRSINYLEELFGQKIEVFAPPQNLLNEKGVEAILNNKLAIIGSYPSIKNVNTLIRLGLYQYLKYMFFRLNNKGRSYPYPLINRKIKIVNHYSLQPSTDLKKLYQHLEFVHKYNGVFILSTHSYGFDFRMRNSNKTMGQAVKEIIDYASTLKNVQFVNVKDVFNDNEHFNSN